MYFCKYCGSNNASIMSLTGYPCARHPLGSNKGKHALYEGAEKKQYHCKYCGNKDTSLTHLTAAQCMRHPLGALKGRHEPAL